MKTAYLIYRPVLDYEESEESYGISLTLKGAEAMKQQMMDYANELLTQMPPSATDDEYEAERDGFKFIPDDIMRDEYNDDVIEKRRQILKEAKWPFGIDLSSDIYIYAKPPELQSGMIEVRKLPLV